MSDKRSDKRDVPPSIVLISSREIEHALELYPAEQSSPIAQTVETPPDGRDANGSWTADAAPVYVQDERAAVEEGREEEEEEEEVFTPAHGPSFLTIARQLSMVALTVLTLVFLAWLIPAWMQKVPPAPRNAVDPVADRGTREAPAAPSPPRASTAAERPERSRGAADTAFRAAMPPAARSQPRERPAARIPPSGTSARQSPPRPSPLPYVTSSLSGLRSSSPAATPREPPTVGRPVPDLLAQPSPLPVLGGGPPPAVPLETALPDERAAATSGTYAPAGVSVAPASNVSAVVPDTNAIQAVLGRYRLAFTNLDSARVAAVWPSVDRQALDRAFSQLAQQEFSFESCQIAVSGVLATARCTGQARHVPKVGPRVSRLEARQWSFTLRKSKDDWIIDSISSR